MPDRTKQFSDELKELISEGNDLRNGLNLECHPEMFGEAVRTKFEGDEEKIAQFIDSVPSFKGEYQSWYSKAQAVIKQVLPDRLADFNSYYEYPRVRKDISFQNYMIKDHLQGLKITRSGYEVVADGASAIPEFEQQLNLLKAAKDALASKLMDLSGILQADLFDSEVESAAALAKAGFLRGGGAICGVVIEKHLRHVCGLHGITVRKKNPGISDLSQLLKDADVTTLAQWRFIQHLADIRNTCDHAKGKEPTKDEIDDLVAGTEKVLKAVF